MSGEVLSSESERETGMPGAVEAKDGRSRRWRRGIGLTLVVFSLLLAYYLIIALLGWQSGQRLLVAQRNEVLLLEINKQKELAQQDLNQDRYALAERRMEWVLERSPNDTEARAIREDAIVALNALLTPVVVISSPVAPTPTPLPSPTPGLIEDAGQELQRLYQLQENEAWLDLVPALLTFQRQFPNYERWETDALLYDGYVNLGLSLVTGEQIEQGLFYLSQAETLKDLPQEVLDYETWAELYLAGYCFLWHNQLGGQCLLFPRFMFGGSFLPIFL